MPSLRNKKYKFTHFNTYKFIYKNFQIQVTWGCQIFNNLNLNSFLGTNYSKILYFLCFDLEFISYFCLYKLLIQYVSKHCWWNLRSKFFKFLRICISPGGSAASAGRPLLRKLRYENHHLK